MQAETLVYTDALDHSDALARIDTLARTLTSCSDREARLHRRPIPWTLDYNDALVRVEAIFHRRMVASARLLASYSCLARLDSTPHACPHDRRHARSLICRYL